MDKAKYEDLAVTIEMIHSMNEPLDPVSAQLLSRLEREARAYEEEHGLPHVEQPPVLH